jgi:CheY-like chemotaxis protein
MQLEGSARPILVVDDEPANRELIRAVLTYDHHQVLVAENGERALELLRTNYPRLVIVDLHLPGMSGTEFIKRVRDDAAFADTEIALYTGTDMSDALRDFMQLMKIRHVIPKPAEPEQIISAVRSALP